MTGAAWSGQPKKELRFLRSCSVSLKACTCAANDPKQRQCQWYDTAFTSTRAGSRVTTPAGVRNRFALDRLCWCLRWCALHQRSPCANIGASSRTRARTIAKNRQQRLRQSIIGIAMARAYTDATKILPNTLPPAQASGTSKKSVQA